MNKKLRYIFALSIGLFLLTSTVASAHQPRIQEDVITEVTEPEISKAYYGQLEGEPHIYTISASEEFELYVNILVPEIEGQAKDLSAEIFKDGESLIVLDGKNYEWTIFFEPFGQSNYWMGPEYKEISGPGEYEIKVWSMNNDSKYSLAVGSIETFDSKEGINALKLIPELKKDFFNESPISFIKSPFGWGYILIMFILAFIFGFMYRAILRKIAKKKPRKAPRNIKKGGRILRFILSLGLLLWAITTTWNPILLFLSGFTLFEAIFSWCGFYAAISRNDCPL